MSNQTADHLRRRDYTGLVSALIDAERVIDDLVQAIADPTSLFLDRDQVEFLARRTRQLVAASREAASRGCP